MPNKNGTGPRGQGSKTGRQMGNCEGAEPIGRGMGRGMRQGMGRGMGQGFGRGIGFNQPVEMTKEEKRKILEAEKASIDKALEELEE